MTPAEILRRCLELNLTQHIDDCVDPDQRARGKANETTFTAIVDSLRGPHCKSAAIRALASELWDTVGGKKVQTAMFDPIATLHFSVHREPKREVGTILIPVTWYESVLTDPVFCVGGVVFTGCQAVSWSKLGHVGNALHDRARAYEAEFLVMIRKTDPQYRFDEYQRGVLRDFPLGLVSFEQ